MIAKFDFGPAKPERRRQTRPVESFAIIYLYKRIWAYRTKSVCENPYDTSKYLVL